MSLKPLITDNEKTMPTIINNPNGENSDSGAGIIIGTVVALLVIVLFFVYVFPGLRAGQQAPAQQNPGGSLDIDITTPAPTTGGNNSGGTGGMGATQ
jgi:hypothetical protein